MNFDELEADDAQLWDSNPILTFARDHFREAMDKLPRIHHKRLPLLRVP